MRSHASLLTAVAIQIVATSPAIAQTMRVLDPQTVKGTGTGWTVDPASGHLGMVFSVATVDGPLPIPVHIRFSANHSVARRRVREPDCTEIPKFCPWVWVEQDRPSYATVHFGYIGATRPMWDGAGTDTLFVLEDGTLFTDRELTPGSSVLTRFVLPEKFQLGAKTPSQIMVQSSGRICVYDATLTDLGSWATRIQGLIPTTYQVTPGAFKVVMDRDRARIYAYFPEMNAWAPLLWVDRFGHHVSFAWNRTTGVGSNLDAVHAVTALNKDGKGVQLQWAERTPTGPITPTTKMDILRADFIGVSAPSLVVSGYPDTALMRPAGLTGVDSPSTSQVGEDVVGPVFRPAEIRMGDPTSATLPMPSWKVLEKPPATGSSQWAAADRVWGFTYDSHISELSSIQDPQGVTTSFQYDNQNLGMPWEDYWMVVRGRSVTKATSSCNSDTLTQNWTRVTPVVEWGTSGRVTTQPNWTVTMDSTFSQGDPCASRSTILRFAGPDDAQQYGNGVLKKREDHVGSVLTSSVEYTYGAAGADQSLNGRLSETYGGMTQIPRQVKKTLDSYSGAQTDRTTMVGGVTEELLLYEYDSLKEILDPARIKTQFNQDFLKGVTKITTAMTYDANTFLQKTREISTYPSLSKTETLTYTTEGHVETVTSSASFSSVGSSTQSYSNWSQGLPQQATLTYSEPGNPSGASLTTQATYDESGRVATSTSPGGVTSTYAYDAWGRLRKVTQEGSPSLTVAFPSELEKTTTSSDGLKTTETYDGFGRLLKRTHPDGRIEEFGYRNDGETSWVRESIGTTSRTSTFLSNITSTAHVQKVVPLSGPSVTTTTEVVGTQRKVTRALSSGPNTTTYYDVVGRVVKEIDPLGVTTELSYEGLGPLTTVVTTDLQGRPQTRSFKTVFGMMTERNEPETGKTIYSDHNALGLPTKVTFANGETQTLAYDGLGRLRQCSATSALSPSLSATAGYTYIGDQLRSAERTIGSETVRQEFTYNGPGKRKDTESTFINGSPFSTVGYAYDTAGRLKEWTYPSGRKVSYGYDPVGRVLEIKMDGKPLVQKMEYGDWGYRTAMTFASGASNHWTMDNYGIHLKDWTMRFKDGTQSTRIFSPDSSGRLSKAEPWISLQHDASGQLSRAQLQDSDLGFTTEFQHDGFGNNIESKLTAGLAPGSVKSFTFNPLLDNRIPPQTPTNINTGWNLDPKGQTRSMGTGPGNVPALTFDWDSLGLLRKATNGTVTAQTYLYAPTGMRIQTLDAADGTQSRRYAYTSGGQLLSEYAPDQAAFSGAKALRVFHAASGPGALSRCLGAFSAGEAVTVSVWFKAPAGTSGSIFLTDSRPAASDDLKAFTALAGNGGWQEIRLTLPMTRSDNLWINLYGDAYTSTSGSATSITSVIYDAVSVTGSLRGQVLQEGFESGLNLGTDPSSTNTWYSCGQSNEVVEGGAPTALKREVIYLGTEAIAEVDTSGQVYELHNNHLGSPAYITGGTTGQLAGYQLFGAYGEQLKSTGYQSLTGYTGHVQQDPTGLIYMRGRYYSPAWHRFINSDQGMDNKQANQYAYAGGNPLMATDPSGMMYLSISSFRNILKAWSTYSQGDFDIYGTNPSDWEMVTIDPISEPIITTLEPIGGAGPKQQTPKSILNKEKCLAIQKMKIHANKYGDISAAARFNVTFAGGNRGQLYPESLFTNPTPYQNLTPTTVGSMDVDWYLTLGAKWYQWGGMALPAYITGKRQHERESRIAGGNRFSGFYGEGIYRRESPFDDPGEAVAVGAIANYIGINQLWTDDWFAKNCASLIK